MSQTNRTQVYRDNEVVMANHPTRGYFAGEVVGKWRGAVMFYDVRDCVTGKVFTVTEAETGAFRVVAVADNGRFYTVTLRFRLGDTFVGDWKGQAVEVRKDQIVRVLMPVRKAA